MTSGIASKGVDLDNIFDLYQAGTTKARAAGINVAGSDTSNRYANIIYGSAAAATGIQSESADLNTLYAKKGTASYPLPINGANYVGQSNGTISSAMDAKITVQIKSDGTYAVTCVGNSPNTTANASGTWLPSGQAATDYQVEFRWSQTSQFTSGPATVTNGASTYQACTTTRQISFDAQVGQLTGLDEGSIGDLYIDLKRISTGVVSTTHVAIKVESAGSG